MIGPTLYGQLFAYGYQLGVPQLPFYFAAMTALCTELIVLLSPRYPSRPNPNPNPKPKPNPDPNPNPNSRSNPRTLTLTLTRTEPELEPEPEPEPEF